MEYNKSHKQKNILSILSSEIFSIDRLKEQDYT